MLAATQSSVQLLGNLERLTSRVLQKRVSTGFDAWEHHRWPAAGDLALLRRWRVFFCSHAISMTLFHESHCWTAQGWTAVSVRVARGRGRTRGHHKASTRDEVMGVILEGQSES
jgi:hypothetical protein